MEQRATLRSIEELCHQLSQAVEASFRVKEHADALMGAAQALADSTAPERRSVLRVNNPSGTLAITFASPEGTAHRRNSRFQVLG